MQPTIQTPLVNTLAHKRAMDKNRQALFACPNNLADLPQATAKPYADAVNKRLAIYTRYARMQRRILARLPRLQRIAFALRYHLH